MAPRPFECFRFGNYIFPTFFFFFPHYCYSFFFYNILITFNELYKQFFLALIEIHVFLASAKCSLRKKICKYLIKSRKNEHSCLNRKMLKFKFKKSMNVINIISEKRGNLKLELL